MNEVKQGVKGFFVNPPATDRRSLNVVMAEGAAEFAEVYTEVTRTVGKKVHMKVHWKLKNASSRRVLQSGLQLTPVMSRPTLRIHFESDICQLAADESGELKLRLRIPEDYNSNHLIMLLRLKHKE